MRLVERETRFQHRGFEHELGQRFRFFGVRIRSRAFLERRDHRVSRVHFERLLAAHVLVTGFVAHGLRLHDAFHVCGPAVLGRHDDARGGGEAVGDLDRFNHGVRKLALPPRGERLERLLRLLKASLFVVVRVAKLEVFLARVGELEIIEFSQVLHGVLIDGIGEVDDFEVLGDELLEERRVFERVDGFSGDVINRLLALLHAFDVLLQRDELAVGLRGLESKKLGEAHAVARVFDDPELDRLAERLPELFILRLVLRRRVIFAFGLGIVIFRIAAFFRELANHVERLANELLLDRLQARVLLESFARHVQGERVRVDDALNEAQILGQQLVELVRDEDTADVQLERARAAVVVVVVVRRRSFGDVENGLEFDVALRLEVRIRERLFRVLGESLVELGVLFLFNFVRASEPDRLDVVQAFPIPNGLGHGLRLRFVVLFVFVAFLIVAFLVVFGVVTGDVSFFILVAGFDGYFFRDFLGVVQVDGEVDELGVTLDESLKLGLFEVLLRFFLEVDVDLHPAAERFAFVLGDGKVAISLRLPHPLLVVVVVFRAHFDKVGDEVDGVETDAELSDQRHVAARRHLVQKRGRSGLGDRTEVVHQVVLRHPDASVANREHLALLVSLDANVEIGVFAASQLLLVGERHESNLVQRIRAVRDQFAQENILVRVQRVDDDVHQSRDLGLELKLFRPRGEVWDFRRAGVRRRVFLRAHCVVDVCARSVIVHASRARSRRAARASRLDRARGRKSSSSFVDIFLSRIVRSSFRPRTVRRASEHAHRAHDARERDRRPSRRATSRARHLRSRASRCASDRRARRRRAAIVIRHARANRIARFRELATSATVARAGRTKTTREGDSGETDRRDRWARVGSDRSDRSDRSVGRPRATFAGPTTRRRDATATTPPRAAPRATTTDPPRATAGVSA